MPGEVNHSTGMKSYGSTPAIRHTYFEGNIYFCNGMSSWEFQEFPELP